MKIITKTISALTMALFTGCIDNQDSGAKEYPIQTTLEAGNMRSEFDANLAKWKASKVELYRFQVDMQCYCFPMGWMDIIVRRGLVAEVDSVPGELKLFEPNQVAYAPTIESLFDRIEPKLYDPDYTVKIEYDSTFGYPKSIEIRQNGNLKDAGLSASVVRLAPL